MGSLRLSCLTLAVDTEQADITTVEGLADGHHLHPIQQTSRSVGQSMRILHTRFLGGNFGITV